MGKKCLIGNFIIIFVISFTILGFAADKKYSVAVLDFESMGTEEYIGKAVSEIMRTALVSNQKFKVVERAQINKALTEQKFQKSGMIDDKSAVEIGKVLGADLIIVGSVVKIGNAYTINSRMIDVKTGEAKLGRNVTGTDLNLLTSMSHELVETLFALEHQPSKPKRPADTIKTSDLATDDGKKDSLSDLRKWEILNG
jgi:TolB-like protein